MGKTSPELTGCHQEKRLYYSWSLSQDKPSWRQNISKSSASVSPTGSAISSAS